MNRTLQMWADLRNTQVASAPRRIALFAFKVCAMTSFLVSLTLYAATQGRIPPDVTVGVRIWPYGRIYPLLDGLFQDVAATQVKSLAIDPNAANATNLDALQQVFQLQAQYSATAGIQNNVAAQQASAASAAALFQAQLISRQSQLIQSQLIAQNEVALAQKTVDSLTANGATSSDLAAAKLQLQLATDNLNSITSQLSDIKSQLGSTTTPSFTALAPSTPPSSPSLPSTLSGPANVPSSFSPNFPATKQMDNQMSLLWERLARLVYTMNQTAASGNYYLIQMDTGIVPLQRKHQMLVTHYQLSCGQVIDIYPRTAAVNIINEKYKENRIGLAAVISFFSWGTNASYNRDHLKITQALGQSAYITGYGVERNDFGWIYGIALGEDTIAPGTRSTFVLVQTPASCTDSQVSLISVDWVKHIPATSFQTGGQNPPSNGAQTTALQKWNLAENLDARLGGSTTADPVKTISYSPVEDDSTNLTPTAAMVAITLVDGLNVDPETTITADGILISRIRDTFGRAITGAGGSGGVLEVAATQLQLNTWVPVNSNELLLNLNPRSFRGHFPTLLMQSPRGVIELRTRNASVQLQGRDCERCKNSLPPLSYPKLPVSSLAAARWLFWSADPTHPNSGKVQYNNLEAKIVLNAVATKGGSTSQSLANLAPLQVIDDTDSNPWGASPQVYVLRQPDDGSILKLDCQPFGPQLVCPSPRMVNLSDKHVQECLPKDPCLYTDAAYQLEVIDGDHSGGAFHGKGVLAPCGLALKFMCSQPLIWKMDNPIWSASDEAWKFRVAMINVSTGERAQLNHQPSCTERPGGACDDLNQAFECPGDGKICTVSFVLRREFVPNFQDSMDLQVHPEIVSAAPVRVIKIGGLRSQLNPLLSSITADFGQMTGTNLVFDELMVGVSGKPIKMDCSHPTDCVVSYPANTPKGYLYFVAQKGGGESGLIPVVLQQAQGISKVLYTPSQKPGANPAGGSTPQVVQPAKPKVPLSSSTE